MIFVAEAHIHAMVSILARLGVTADEDPTAVGKHLWRANAESFLAVHGPVDGVREAVEEYEPPQPYPRLPSDRWFGVLNGYEEQCYGHLGFNRSVPFRWLVAAHDERNRNRRRYLCGPAELITEAPRWSPLPVERPARYHIATHYSLAT